MTSSQEPDIFPAEQARDVLKAAIADKLGDNWDDPQHGWVVVSNHDYMARLNKGRVNVDFYVDYFDGSVRTETSEINSGQDVGRIFAWVLIALVAVITLVLARGLGVI